MLNCEENIMTKLNSFIQLFHNKKSLLTGHTGFKGSWLSAWLHLIDTDVYGISIETPPSRPSHFDAADFSKFVTEQRFEIRKSN